MRPPDPFQKNHAKKPTVGFLFSRTRVKMRGYERMRSFVLWQGEAHCH
jgi:hypothetical protein